MKIDSFDYLCVHGYCFAQIYDARSKLSKIFNYDKNS